MNAFMERSAVFSPCRRYRYELWRNWDDTKPYCQFIGLNPSTADENRDDPTITRCISFAQTWGYGAFVMTNTFGYRSTWPEVLAEIEDPNGPGNDEALVRVAKGAGIVIASWGAFKLKLCEVRRADVLNLLHSSGIKLHCLERTQGGYPKHPLYCKSTLKPQPYP